MERAAADTAGSQRRAHNVGKGWCAGARSQSSRTRDVTYVCGLIGVDFGVGSLLQRDRHGLSPFGYFLSEVRFQTAVRDDRLAVDGLHHRRVRVVERVQETSRIDALEGSCAFRDGIFVGGGTDPRREELVHVGNRVRGGCLARKDDSAVDPLGAQAVRPGAAGVGDEHDVRDAGQLRALATLEQADRLVRISGPLGQQPKLLEAAADETVAGKIDDQLLECSTIDEGVDRREQIACLHRVRVIDKEFDVESFSPQPLRNRACPGSGSPELGQIARLVDTDYHRGAV